MDLPIRIPVAEKFTNMGTFAMGKVMSGSLKKGCSLMLMPNRTKVQVTQILEEETEKEFAASGDNISLKLKGVEEEDLQAGYVYVPTFMGFIFRLALPLRTALHSCTQCV